MLRSLFKTNLTVTMSYSYNRSSKYFAVRADTIVYVERFCSGCSTSMGYLVTAFDVDCLSSRLHVMSLIRRKRLDFQQKSLCFNVHSTATFHIIDKRSAAYVTSRPVPDKVSNKFIDREYCHPSIAEPGH